MTNRAAAVLAILLACLLIADWLFADSAVLTYLGQSLVRVTEWLAFWR